MRVDRSYVSITKEKWGQKVPGLLNALFHERDPTLFVSTRCRRMWETVSTQVGYFIAFTSIIGEIYCYKTVCLLQMLLKDS